MNRKTRVVYCVIFVTALVFYFLSESMLRQSAVACVDTEDIDIDVILNKLPSSIKDSVNHTLEMARLQEALAKAKADKERVVALNNLAFFSKEKKDKERYFNEIITKYPTNRNSASAYVFFLMEKDLKNHVDIKRFHEFISRCPTDDQYSIWQQGLGKLRDVKASKEQQLSYLEPLLNRKPEFYDYIRIYEYLEKLASSFKNDELAEFAKIKQDSCIDLPSYEQFMMEKENKKDPKNKKKRSTKRKKK